MIEYQWSIVCEHAVVDRFTNNLSLLHVVDQITVGGSPESGQPMPMPFDIMTLWQRGDVESPEVAQTRTVIVAPNGDEISSTEVHVDLTDNRRLRARLRVVGMPFRGFGRYRLRADVQEDGDWVVVGGVSLEVRQKEPVPD
jgi:hypothetical protein